MQRKRMTKEDFLTLIARWLTQTVVSGPVRKGKHFVYADLETPQDLYISLDYVRSLLPPKKYCFPQHEELLRFTVGDQPSVGTVMDDKPRIVIGLHPCDLHALQMLDKALTSDSPDEHWMNRRASLKLVGVDCLPDAYCFCTSMHTNLPPQDGYDLFLTDIGDAYVIEVGSDRGASLLNGATGVEDASAEDLAKVLAFREKKAESVQQRLEIQPENLPLALTALRNSPVWQEQANKCLACGSCNITCATCYCFDVLDRMNLSLQDGVRERRWDGCLLPDFAKVASGENFRSKGVQRYRHRYYRKFEYLPVRYRIVFCCGCGRCSVNCIPDIANPVTVLNEVTRRSGKGQGKT